MSRLEAIGDLDVTPPRRWEPSNGYPATKPFPPPPSYDSDATARIPKLPPDLSWLESLPDSYRSVGVPGNRSSVPGVEDKKDWGLRLILVILSLALVANATAFAYVVWLLR